MERLTKRIEGGQAVFHECHGTCGTCDGANCYCIGLMVDRLAAYEDTGLTPEEIDRIVDAYGRGHTLRTESAERLEIVREIKADRLRELVQAAKEARLAVLPCKVGDTVYRVLTTRDCPPVISEVKIKTVGQAADLIGRMGKRKLLSYYLTREEAESTMKEGQG